MVKTALTTTALIFQILVTVDEFRWGQPRYRPLRHLNGHLFLSVDDPADRYWLARSEWSAWGEPPRRSTHGPLKSPDRILTLSVTPGIPARRGQVSAEVA